MLGNFQLRPGEIINGKYCECSNLDCPSDPDTDLICGGKDITVDCKHHTAPLGDKNLHVNKKRWRVRELIHHAELILKPGYPVHLRIINNYWMRLCMALWIIKTEVCVICRSRRPRQITRTRGFDNSWYHAKTEFNNCFIIHFSHNSSSETEAKRWGILFLRRTLQGA